MDDALRVDELNSSDGLLEKEADRSLGEGVHSSDVAKEVAVFGELHDKKDFVFVLMSKRRSSRRGG